MSKVCRWAVACLLLAPMGSFAQEPIRFPRHPDISPDGRQVAFSYLGDIWLVDAIGGIARPLTTHEAHDTMPIFSPDGRSLAFSSNRHGGYDVFIVPVHGGKPRRLTFDSDAEFACGWSPDGREVLFTSAQAAGFPPQRDLYAVPASGGRVRRLTQFEGRDGVFSPSGDLIAFVRGPGTWYRKGYRGSANDDLWLMKADGTAQRQLTTFDGQDGSPSWSADGKWIYYVSEQFGPANVCKISVDGSASPQQVTTHSAAEAVRRARASANGQWIVYESGADLWLCSTRGEPNSRKIPIEAYADDRTNPEMMQTFTSGIREYAVAPNEQWVTLVIQGEMFLVPMAGGKAKRLTDHPGNDHDMAWAPDMKKMVFVSDRDGQEHLYLLESDDADHPEFVRAHKYKVTPLTRGEVSDSSPAFAPDGKTITFLRMGRLWTMKADGQEAKPLVDEPTVIDYKWSPDGKWIAYSRMDGNFASEIYLIPAGGGKPVNATRYATRNFGITWSQDGKRLCFISQRRNDLDVFVLNLQKPAADGAPPPAPGHIDFENLPGRVERVTSFSSEEFEAAISADGTRVVFRSNTLNNDDLWMATIGGGMITRLTSGNRQAGSLFYGRNGNLFFLDRGGNLCYLRTNALALNPAGPGAPVAVPETRLPFTAKMKVNRNELFTQMFDEAWRLLLHRFYDPKMHGTDWKGVRQQYRPLVPHVAMREDFYDLVHLMLGELNASHLGIGGGLGRRPEAETADLGLVFDDRYPGPGLRVAEIIKGGPADRAGLALKPGEFIMAIDGIELTQDTNVSELLNDKVNEMVTVAVTADPAKEPKRRKVEMRAVDRGTLHNLMYARWVNNNARRVAELSGGRLGYIHIRGMDTPSLDEFVRSLYSENFEKEGLVLDVRYNGGGFTHDKILAYLGGREHTTFVSREGARGAYMRENDRKWTKPLTLLINNRSYSDAEIFPSAFRTLGLGKIVGLPTGGFVIGTGQVALIDGSQFRVPRLGVYSAQGVNMDKQGVQPDFHVDITPGDAAQGKDPQLAKAVEVLLNEVEQWKRKSSAGQQLAEGQTPVEPKKN